MACWRLKLSISLEVPGFRYLWFVSSRPLRMIVCPFLGRWTLCQCRNTWAFFTWRYLHLGQWNLVTILSCIIFQCWTNSTFLWNLPEHATAGHMNSSCSGRSESIAGNSFSSTLTSNMLMFIWKNNPNLILFTKECYVQTLVKINIGLWRKSKKCEKTDGRTPEKKCQNTCTCWSLELSAFLS